MKRFLAGLGWFAVIWVGASSLGSSIAGAVAGASTNDPSLATELGARAGADFWLHHGSLILLAAITLSILGSVTGWLPGTRGTQRPRG